MLVSDIPGFWSWVQTTEFAKDRLWLRPLELISETEIQLFYARAGLRNLKKEAHNAIDQLQSELIVAGVDGVVPREALRIIAHEVPVERFTIDAFIDNLVQLSQVRRSALLFSLCTRQHPDLISELTWKEALGFTQLPNLASEILHARNKLRHIRVPYVFWEESRPGIVQSPRHLCQQAEAAFSLGWPAIQTRWTDAIWMNDHSEGSSFLGLVEEVASGRI